VMRDTQVDDLKALLEEVKYLYNERYPLDHVDDVDQEIGYDADGLLWVQHTGQGAETREAKIAKLEALLEEVKGLYNEQYPLDYIDNVDYEIGCDGDGLLWVEQTGHSAEARELKMEELFDLLEEVKGLYNERYLLDHVDDVGCEIGCDADGLHWVQHVGQGATMQRAKLDELQDLLQEVKILYSEKYPHDHAEDEQHEIGRDADGLLWIQYTGHGAEVREAKMGELHDLLEEVRSLYNAKYPLDHVDDVGCEMGRDAEGLLWVKHIGQGMQTCSTDIAHLEDLLEEVKGLYNQKYPHDHVDDDSGEVGYDADGLHWVKYTGRSRVDELQDLLEEVKGLYNKRYPLDHVDDMDREIWFDSDDLLWTKQTGQGIERSQVERLEDLLQEVKCLYNERYPEDSADDTGNEIGYDADGLLWMQFTGQGIERSQVEKLEDLLAEVKGLYNKRYPEDHAEDSELEVGTDADGLLWVQYTGQGSKPWDAKVERLEDLLEEVKDLYNDKYPQDHVDDDDREVGIDADGLLWVTYTGHASQTREQEVDLGRKHAGPCAQTRERNLEELQDLLEEVKGLYNARYPLDHVDEISHEVGVDAEGLFWMAYTGQGTNMRARKVESLEDLLEEVRGLYNMKYPLDHVDDEETEVGHDLDGLCWVRYTGSGGRLTRRVAQLEDLLDEVKCLYNQTYPLDNLDDEGCEIGYDADGLLWVSHSGIGIEGAPVSEKEEGVYEVACSKSKLEKLQDMLAEVMRLYNERYPLDNVDDLGSEVGYDADGLLWVRSTALDLDTVLEPVA